MTKRRGENVGRVVLLTLLCAACADIGSAQAILAGSSLPEAPLAQMQRNVGVPVGLIGSVASVSQSNAAQAGSGAEHRNTLTRADAEKMAIKNNPRVSLARFLSLAQHQVVRETRSIQMPAGSVSLTAENASDGSRISAGSLTAPRLFEHAGAGGEFTQLITDFGRSKNLVAFSRLQEKAQDANLIATQDDIVLATDQAFYNALQAQALLQVAQQNVETRQTLESQVSVMANNKLKSTLDLSFADVSLSQAKLLLLDAQNNTDSTMAALDAVLGLDKQVTFELVDEATAIQAPPLDSGQLIQLGLQQRPDLQSLEFDRQAAMKFSRAQHDQIFPTIRAAGTLGTVPIRPAAFYSTNWWGGVGVNMNIPVFNGFLFSAQAKEADVRAQAASERTRDLRDRVVRDIRTAWLAANTSYQRVAVSRELLDEANLALKLAQTRYQLGLSSIVELSQAEYQQTDAAIGNTNAQYQYRLALATLNYQVGANP